MAVVDIVKYDGSPDVFVWKYPYQELGTWTQLIVNESQEAIFYKGGQALDSFGAGRHTLSTNNLPVLRDIINLPFGGRSPFTAEVWFVNKAHVLDIKWGTPTPIQIQDPTYKVFVPVSSYGQMGLTIEDARKFLQKLAGNQPIVTGADLQKYFKGIFLTKIKGVLSSYIVHEKISIVEINAHINDLSEFLQKETEPLLSEYGVRLVNFSINDISVPKNDPAVIKLGNALAKKAEMDILGYNYTKERSFDTLDAAVKKGDSATSSILSTGIGLSMGMGIGGSLGNSVGNSMKNITDNLDVSDTAACPRCGKKETKSSSFCRHCGSSMTARQEAAPTTENSAYCAKCDKSYPAGHKFCLQCGSALQKKFCDCGFEIKDNMRFCPLCGKSAGN